MKNMDLDFAARQATFEKAYPRPGGQRPQVVAADQPQQTASDTRRTAPGSSSPTIVSRASHQS